MISYTQSAFWAGLVYVSTVFSMLIRNIIFARLLNPNDFSIALTFGVVLSFFEYLSSFGHELLMQRSNDGGTHRFQASMHSVMILRGLLIAALVVLISPFIPILLNLPSETFNYSLLAIVPLLNGFAHLDPQRAHRHNDFKLSAKIGMIADSSSIIVAFISISLWHDYWAFYISFVFRHSISTILSHWYASRAYCLAFEKAYFLALWNFGLPLILIGALKYFGTEVDKALIASYVGLPEFTLYFLTIMVTANAANIVSVGLSKIFIRRISTSTKARLNYVALENGIISLYLVLPILFTITLFGEHIIVLVFGQQYTPIPYLFPAVIVLVACRQLSHWLNQIVVGCIDTKLMLKADVLRAIALAIMLPMIVSSGDVRYFAWTFAVSEIIYIAILSQLVSRSITRFTNTALRLLAIVGASVVSFFALYWMVYDSTILLRMGVLIAGILTLVTAFNLLSHTCRNETSKLTRLVLNRD